MRNRSFLFFVCLTVTSLLTFYSSFADAKKTILITGFDAFAGRERNNSSLVSEELKRLFETHPQLKNEYSLEFIVLPVQARVAASKAREYIDKMNPAPDLVLSLGESSRLAKKGRSVEINFNAYNKQSSKIYKEDKKSVHWDTSKDGKIYPYWEDSVKFNFSALQMYCALHENEKKWVSLEDNIGSYVCNDTAFDLALYLRDQNQKNSIAKRLTWPFESERNSKLEALKKEEELAVKNSHAQYLAVEKREKDLLNIINANPSLKRELPRLYELIESERNPKRYNNNSQNQYDNRRTQTRNYDLSLDRRKNNDDWNVNRNSSNRYGYTLPSDNSRSDSQSYSSSTNNDQSSSSYLLPQTLLDYKRAMEDTRSDSRRHNAVVENYRYRARAIEGNFTTIARSIENVALDSHLSAKKPEYGFIHIPILGQGEKRSPLEIAQVIAIMVKGSFEKRFPNATLDGRSGRVNCGLDTKFVQSPAYKNLISQRNSIDGQLSTSIYNFKSGITKPNEYMSDDDAIKNARKSKYKSDPYAQSIVRLTEELKTIRQQIASLEANAPQAHSSKESYFNGYEKYQSQGIFSQKNTSKNILKVQFVADQEITNLPSEFNIDVKTDSNNNAVLLLRNDHFNQTALDLSTFETQAISILNVSTRSHLQLRLDNSKQYSKYELRKLKADGITYYELNSNISYNMRMEYSYPVIKERTEYEDQYVVNNYGDRVKQSIPKKVRYWASEYTYFPLELKFYEGKWSFYYQDNPFNILQLAIEKTNEPLIYIRSFDVFHEPEEEKVILSERTP